MKLLWWIDHLGLGGAQQALYGLAAGLSKKGYRQTIVCLNGVVDKKLCKKLECLGIPVRIVGKWQLISGIGVVRTLVWLVRESFDVAITSLFFSDILGLLLSRAVKIPYLISSQQSSNVHYSNWQCAAISQLLKLANVVVLNSETYKKAVLSTYVPNSVELKVVSNGTEVSAYRSGKTFDAIRTALRLSSDARIIGNVGRLSEEKGIDLLITAISILPNSNVHLVLAGSGPAQNDLEKHVASYGLEDRVHFLGYYDDVSWVYDNLEVYVQPSRFEGMPNSVMEAMASSCPVVATAVDGICELIPSEKYGWLVPPENSSELAMAIEEALSNSSEASSRAYMGNLRVCTEFSLSNMINAWDQILAKRSHLNLSCR